MTTIFLFDIDQTLIRADRLALRTMERVLLEQHGVPNAMTPIDFAGRTDRAILRDCYALHGLTFDDFDAQIERFRALYIPYLEADLAAAPQPLVLPGVIPLLDALAAREDVRLGLGTGNFRASAALKLGAVGLWERFLDGGFADDGEARNDVIAAGLRRLRGDSSEPCDGWIVGDSPHDITAAHANGLRCVAVATGRFPLDQLRELGPEVAFEDLSDTAAFLAATIDAVAEPA